VKTRTRALIGAAAAVLALAATAGPALASGFTLHLSSPRAVVGKPFLLTATGTIPADQVQFPYWFSLDAIPTSLMTTCPSDRWQASQIANASGGGGIIVLSQPETPDASGGFTIPVGIRPTAAGSVLLCGYTDDGETQTMAYASLLLRINAASAPSPPVQLARAIRSCHALLGGAGEKRCVRRAVRRAKAGCRHYRSHRRSARCLRNVRRVAHRMQ
jgi:hypothetical protein